MGDSYDAWNRALISEYFPPGGRGSLAYLPVDDDELEAMASTYGLCEPGQAVEHFVAAVQAKLATKGGSFVRFSVGVGGWRRVRNDPPYVAGLAFCVLAASKMERDMSAQVASHNYYTQLNRLLGRLDRAGAPRGFDTLGEAWRDLAAWLDEDCEGSRGASTIRTGEHAGKHVGYPLSQCLLRACDRRRLPDFFTLAGLAPGSEISSDRLFVLLRAWAAHPSCGLTARGIRAIAHAEDVDRFEIAETVTRELAVWDGELRDARGRKRGRIHLLVIQRARGTVVRFIAARPPGFPDEGWVLEHDDRAIMLQPHVSSEEWFDPLDLAVSKASLESGLRLVSGNFALTFDPAAAIPCRQAAVSVGGYISQPEATLWEPHLAVFQRHLAEPLFRQLRPFCEGSLTIHPSETNLPRGWAVTREFSFQRIPVGLGPEFARLAPRIVATTAFEGGLRLSQGIYLSGGEPDALIASDSDPDMTVEIDGVREHLQEGTLRLPLSEMRLKAGTHYLKADVTRTFSSVDTFGDVVPPGAGTLGHLFARHKSYKPESAAPGPVPPDPPADRIVLTGAAFRGKASDLPVDSPRPLLCRSGGREYAVLGSRPGEVARPLSTDAPGWLAMTGLGEFFQFIEISPDFAPVWLLREDSAGQKTVSVLDFRPPELGPGAEETARLILRWRDAQTAEAERDAWGQYIAAASGETEA